MSKENLWKSRKQIIEGIKNKVFKKESIELISKERLEICNKCPHIDKTGEKCFVLKTNPCCSLCGCSLGLMTRSLSSECSDETNVRWKALLKDEDEELIEKLEN